MHPKVLASQNFVRSEERMLQLKTVITVEYGLKNVVLKNLGGLCI